MSAGAFLKNEFHSLRGSRQSDGSSDDIRMSQLDGHGIRVSLPEIPERRLSKSKPFFFKLGGRKEKEAKPTQAVNSTTSKNTLVRRLSRGTNNRSNSDSSDAISLPSVDSSLPLQRVNSKDIADVIVDARISSYGNNAMRSTSPPSMENWATSAKEVFLLCPEITITPETSSLESGSTNLWVALEVTGTLRLANNHDHSSAKLREGRRTISDYSAGMRYIPPTKFFSLLLTLRQPI